MKYRTVRIEPSSTEKGVNWRASFSADDMEREDTETFPNGMGFYHYPETEEDEHAFYRLRDKMELDHLNKISELRRSLYRLRRLDFKDCKAIGQVKTLRDRRDHIDKRLDAIKGKK